MGATMSIGEILATTLNDLGQPAPNDIIQTVLLKDGRFFGHKYCYDGGYAVLQAGSNIVEFFGEDGKSLTNAAIKADNEAAA